jgi:hypothetical protein
MGVMPLQAYEENLIDRLIRIGRVIQVTHEFYWIIANFNHKGE